MQLLRVAMLQATITCNSGLIARLRIMIITHYNACYVIMKVNHACCVHITDYGLIAYQRIQAPFTHETKAYKISFVIQSRTHSLQSDEPHIVLLSNTTVA